MKSLRCSAVLALLCLASGWWYAACVSSHGYVGLHRGATNDYFSFWNPGRALLDHQDPYSLAVAEHTQVVTYGALAKDVGLANNLRLVYPIAGMFPLLSLSLLPFRVADVLALLLFSALSTLAVPLIRGKWDGESLLYAALTFSCYPVILAVQMRQPTLFYFGLAAASFALLRSEKLVWAGMLAALAAGKPQIALPVLLPMLIWTLAEWRARRRFAISLSATSLVMLGASLVISPGWIPRWLDSLREYSGYVHPSVNVATFGASAGAVISAVLLVGLCITLWLMRGSDLWQQVALSVVVFSVVIQGEPYNLVLLLFPALWIAEHAREAPSLAMVILRVALLELWMANVAGIILLYTGHPAGLGIAIAAALPVMLALFAVVVATLSQFILKPYAARADVGGVPAGLREF